MSDVEGRAQFLVQYLVLVLHTSNSREIADILFMSESLVEAIRVAKSAPEKGYTFYMPGTGVVVQKMVPDTEVSRYELAIKCPWVYRALVGFEEEWGDPQLQPLFETYMQARELALSQTPEKELALTA